MKKVLATVLIIGISALAVVAAGCIDLTGQMGRATPTPYIIYGPISPTPTPVPASTLTATPTVVVKSSQPSDDVKLIMSPVDSKMVTVDRGLNGQFENFTMFVANDATAEVKNVNIIVAIRDNSGTNIDYQIFDVGDFPAGAREQVWLVTKEHRDADFMIITFKVTWGENGEYYSTEEYKKNLRSFVY